MVITIRVERSTVGNLLALFPNVLYQDIEQFWQKIVAEFEIETPLP